MNSPPIPTVPLSRGDNNLNSKVAMTATREPGVLAMALAEKVLSLS